MAGRGYTTNASISSCDDNVDLFELLRRKGFLREVDQRRSDGRRGSRADGGRMLVPVHAYLGECVQLSNLFLELIVDCETNDNWISSSP